MEIIKLLERTKSIIFTPIDNIDFENKKINDNTLMDEIEVKFNDNLSIFDTKTQNIINTKISDIKEGQWIYINKKLHKILHIVTNEFTDIL